MRRSLYAVLVFAVLSSCRSVPDTDSRTAPLPGATSRTDLGWTQVRDDHYAEDRWRWQYPSWAHAVVAGGALERDFDLRVASNPFLLHGDFDGDGRTDVAAWVERRDEPSETGVVIVHRAGGAHLVLGGGPNWELYPREVARDPGETVPTLRGDALLLVKPEATSTLIYWDGAAYVSLPFGD